VWHNRRTRSEHVSGERALTAALATVGLFLGTLVFCEVRRIGLASRARHPGELVKGAAAAEGAVFGMLGLLIAFSFSGAASRFEDRRHLIVEEANAVGTAYLRLDLLSGDARTELREMFRRYLDIRIATYREDTLIASDARRAEGAALRRTSGARPWPRSGVRSRRRRRPCSCCRR
jgi:hypothetical protein